MDLQAVRATASGIARAAGAALMKTYDQPHQETVKRTFNDIVTEGDKASEAVILDGLLRHFPDHHIMSEESGRVGAPVETAEYQWHLDPLDGTSNYASNIPLFTVSMGMSDRNLRPLVAVVYDPFSDELFSAARGHGTTLNGRSIQVSATSELGQAMLCTGFPYDATTADNNMKEWAAFMTRTRGLRRFGSVALELAYVAVGRLDGLWERRLNPWDIMAGILLVREAGGTITDFAGKDSDAIYQARELVASNTRLHDSILSVLLEVRGG